jgi:hypothetical protein
VVDRLGRIVPLVDHIQLVFARFFQDQVFGAGLIKSRSARNAMRARLSAFPRRDCATAYLRSCVDEAVSCDGSLEMWIGPWGITESIVPQEPRAMLMARL